MNAEVSAGSGSSAAADDWSLDFSVTMNRGAGIELFEETDPYAEIAEHAAISYANGQTGVARSTLENAIHGNGEPGAVRLWHMLFDLLRVTGDQSAFELLGMDFARVCELSPPSWSVEPAEKENPPMMAPLDMGGGVIALQGVLLSDNPALDEMRRILAKKAPCRLDFRRLAGVDADAASMLSGILGEARKKDLAWGLSYARSFSDRLALRIASGQVQEASLWQLQLELLLFLGDENTFEERAVDYAVKFELSPPSWEPPKKPPMIPESEDAGSGSDIAADEVSMRLEGDLLQGNLGAVQALLKSGEETRLDFSGVRRLDFVSAGMLATLLKEAGGKAVIVHPNYLVAELLRVMGVDQVARLEIAKH
ncbi:MAG: STAS domain-containing protein [Zoogloeaceae bacterium]|nr:STAS domain-containing protein [Zoogloeaceae bacterium]